MAYKTRRWIKKWGFWIVFLLVASVVANYLPSQPDIARPTYLSVKYVVDGDTLQLSDNRKVRLIGVDTPEAYESNKLDREARRTKQSKFVIMREGKKASAFTKKLAQNQRVRLEFDPANMKNQHLDKYGRLLAYVYILSPSDTENTEYIYVDNPDDGRMLFLNASLLSAGYAEAFRRFRFERKVEFVALEKEAKQKKRGLWSSKNVPFFEHKKRK